MDHRGRIPGSLCGATPQQPPHERPRVAEELRKHRGRHKRLAGIGPRRETVEYDLAALDNEIPSGIR